MRKPDEIFANIRLKPLSRICWTTPVRADCWRALLNPSPNLPLTVTERFSSTGSTEALQQIFTLVFSLYSISLYTLYCIQHKPISRKIYLHTNIYNSIIFTNRQSGQVYCLCLSTHLNISSFQGHTLISIFLSFFSERSFQVNIIMLISQSDFTQFYTTFMQ